MTWCWPRDEPRPQTDPSVAMAASWPLERSQRSEPVVRSTLDTKSRWEEWEKKHRERIREWKRKGRHRVRGHYLSSSFLHFIILSPSFLSSGPSFWVTSDFDVCFGQRLDWPDHERVPNTANNTTLKGIVQPKIKILSSFTCPQVVPNLYEFLCCVEHKGRYFEECGKLNNSGPSLTSMVYFFTMEVNGASCNSFNTLS